MAASASSGDDDVMSDINITPLVDVVLVLLIVFMITAPAIVSIAPIKVNLPVSKSVAVTTDRITLNVELRRGGSGQVEIYLNDSAVTRDDLMAYLQETVEEPEEQPINLSADEGIPYGDVADLLDTFASMRMTKIALLTKHVDSL